MIFTQYTAGIPSNARISYSDKRVFIPKGISLSANGKLTKNRIVIGQYIEPGKMHPNHNYREMYPTDWESLSGAQQKTGTVKIGLYVAVNSIVQDLGIYEDLVSVYGSEDAHAILDYCSFMIGAHTNAAIQMESFMKDKAVFTANGVFNDDWYSDFFREHMPSEKNELFKEKWINRCFETGIKEAYICVDGSNNNCEAEGVEIAEHGHAKSHENKDIVGFMYAVDSVTRKPIYCCEYRGGMIDSKAVMFIVNALKEQKIKVKGFIVDKGYCDEKVLDYLEKHHIEYVLKLKQNTQGHTDMLFEHMEDIRFKTVCFIPGTNYFGITDKKQIFKNSDIRCCVHLYYDWKNGGERAITLMEKVYREKYRADEAIRNKEDYEVSDKEMKQYLIITRNNRKRITAAEINHEALQGAVDQKGYSSLATSENMSAVDANALYDMRNNSEQIYMFMKSHQGFDITHVHGTESVYAKYMIVFIASVIRNEILHACQKCGYSTNVALNELSLLTMQLRNGKYYTVTHNESKRQLKLLEALGIETSELDQIADKTTKANSGIIRRQKKLKPGPKKGSHRKQYDEDGNVIKRKPGPKPGSHHKKKYNKDGSERQKPGPKPGSKRGPKKPTAEAEQLA